MANATTGPKSLTDMMAEINNHRYLQHRNFQGKDGCTYALTQFAFNAEECLEAVFHDVRQPLVPFVWPMPDFKAFCSIPEREQSENKLPEEKAAEAAPAP